MQQEVNMPMLLDCCWLLVPPLQQQTLMERLVTIDFIMKIMFLISVLYLLLINCYGRLQANYLNQILKRTEFWNRLDELIHDHLQLSSPKHKIIPNGCWMKLSFVGSAFCI
jgi:hypothetical protein